MPPSDDDDLTADAGASELAHLEAAGGDYFGWCPDCGQNYGYRNIGPNHWFYCDAHRTRWCAGSNLFSGWRTEDETLWTENARRIESYREVDGYTPTAAMLERLVPEEGGRL